MFDAAHTVASIPGKCRRTHGHTYRFRVEFACGLDVDKGYRLSFADIDDAVEPIVKRLDHQLLNDVIGTPNPTTEVVLMYLVGQINASRIVWPVAWAELRETPRGGAVYRAQ